MKKILELIKIISISLIYVCLAIVAIAFASDYVVTQYGWELEVAIMFIIVFCGVITYLLLTITKILEDK